MKRLVHMKVAQMTNYAGQVPVIHPTRCGIGALSTN